MHAVLAFHLKQEDYLQKSLLVLLVPVNVASWSVIELGAGRVLLMIDRRLWCHRINFMV